MAQDMQAGRKHRNLLATFVALAACSGTPEETPIHPAGRPSGRPNVLLILADDLGYGDLGSYGGTIATPHIDRLARQGLRFTSFYANGPICTPTRVALLTGRYPQRYGLYDRLEVDSSWGLPADAVTLPRLLRGAGYETMHVGKWHVGHAEQAFRPLARGFDGFFGFLNAHHLPKTYHDPRLRRDEEQDSARSGHLTDLLTAEAATFLRRRSATTRASSLQRRPFFLNLWYFNPHKPIQPPPRWAERYDDTIEGRYAALVSALDENVGRLLAVLDETGLARETLVVFLSDNGGARDVHGGRNGPFRGGKNQLLEGGIRVPMIVRWPGRVAPGTVSDARAASFDLLPTIAGLAGVDLDDVPTDGRNLAAVLGGAPDDFAGPLFWDDLHHSERRFAVHQGRWKLRSTRGRTTLHDLRRDPGETTDLAADRPEIVAELEAAYRTWRSQLPAPANTRNPVTDASAAFKG